MRLRWSVLLAVLCCVLHGAAQQLAHPGWRGNSIRPEPWWRHAVGIRFAPTATFADVTEQLHSMADAGADTILLPALEPTDTTPFSPRFGSAEDLDTLLREASARRMHVVLQMPLQQVAGQPETLRFWMIRGVSGLDLGTLGSGDMDAARAVRAAMNGYPGARVLMARVPGYPPHARSRRTAAEPVTLHRLSADDPLPSRAVLASGAFAVDTVPAQLATLAKNVLPVVDASVIREESDRENVRNALLLRAAGRSALATPLSLDAPAAGPVVHSRHRHRRRSHPTGR